MNCYCILMSFTNAEFCGFLWLIFLLNILSLVFLDPGATLECFQELKCGKQTAVIPQSVFNGSNRGDCLIIGSSNAKCKMTDAKPFLHIKYQGKHLSVVNLTRKQRVIRNALLYTTPALNGRVLSSPTPSQVIHLPIREKTISQTATPQGAFTQTSCFNTRAVLDSVQEHRWACFFVRSF